MRVPVSWLRDYVAVEMPLPELAERLAVSTAEVDTIEHHGVPDLDGNLGLFRVGHVLEAGKHPNADRLQLCRVDVGDAEPRQIVCGAWNFRTGAKVAVALDGATLPGGLKLERRKLRGEVSEGMILSERELELGPEHSGILVLPDEWKTGTPLAELLPLADAVLVIEPTGNRPDLFSVYGIAREVAALYGLELSPPPGSDPESAGDEQVDIRIEDLEGCPRYVGRLFHDVRLGPSPPWLKARLSAAGMRPISNVVDVTNYVMLALGSPLHAFDFDTLAGGSIVVRRAAPGEEIRTLDGTLRRLDPRDLVIADAERPIGLAGIMGGEETEVTESTTSVLLEAANFEPTGILASSERLRLRTESSNRWEKGVDPYLPEQAMRLASELLVRLAAARWSGTADVQGRLPERPVVRLRPQRTGELIGLDVPTEQQRQILQRLGCEVDRDWTVTVPTWRSRDLLREIDVIEEVARFRLDEIPFTLPARRAMFGRLTHEQRLRRVVEDVLAGAGFSEVYTPSLVPAESAPGAVELAEPLTAEQAVLRPALLPSLVEAARRNVDAGNHGVALFEIASVYQPSGGQLPRERRRVAGIAEGGLAAAKRAVELLYSALKIEPTVERSEHELLHPGRSARVPQGVFGEVRPGLLEGRWGGFELDLGDLVAAVPARIEYEDVISFPAVRQDLAFVVPEAVAAAELAAAMREAAGAELREVRVFDEYRSDELGPGKKSIAFAVAFQSPERTLTDDDAAQLRRLIVESLATRFGATLRA